MFADLSIAVNKDNYFDKMSAKLLCLFYTKQNKNQSCRVLESKSPLMLLDSKVVDFAIDNGENLDKLDHDRFKSLVALYKNLLFFIVPQKSDIENFIDIKDKNIKIAYSKDDKYLIDTIINKFELSKEKFIPMEKKKIYKMLKKGDVDAALILEPYQSKLIKSITAQGGFTIRQLVNKKFSQLVRSNNFILKGRILKVDYPQQKHNLITIGTKSVLLTNKNTSDEKIYNLTNTLLLNMERLQKSDPIYKDISKKNMLEEIVLPQHESSTKAINGIDLNDTL